MTVQPVRPLFRIIDSGGQKSLWLTAEICSEIEKRSNIQQIRIRSLGVNATLAGALIALRTVASSSPSFSPTTVLDEKRQPAPRSKWLTTGQAAEVAGVTRQAILKAIGTCRLKATKINGRYKIGRQDLEHWQATRSAKR